MTESGQADAAEPADIGPAELREAIAVAGPILRGELLSAFGELLDDDPAEARTWLERLDRVMDIDLAEVLRSGDPGSGDDPTAQAAPFFRAGLEVASQAAKEMTAETIFQEMAGEENPGIDLSGLRELLGAGTHTHSFKESLVANIRLSYASDVLAGGSRLGWVADTDNARAVAGLAEAHREAVELATDADVGFAIRAMLGAGGVIGGLMALGDDRSGLAALAAIGIGAAVLIVQAVRGPKAEREPVRQQHEDVKLALTTAMSALHEPVVVGPEVARTARDRLGTTVSPDRPPPGRQR